MYSGFFFGEKQCSSEASVVKPGAHCATCISVSSEQQDVMAVCEEQCNITVSFHPGRGLEHSYEATAIKLKSASDAALNHSTLPPRRPESRGFTQQRLHNNSL